MRLIKLLEEESYMSFGTLETDEVMVNEMKDKVKKSTIKERENFSEKNLNRGNVLKAIKIWAISAVKTSTRGD